MIWLIMVAFLSLYPFESSGGLDFPWADKLFHFVLYAVTGALFLVTFEREGRPFIRRNALVAAVVAAAAYGLIMEYAQGYTVARHFEWADAGVNAAGAFAAVAYIYVLRRRKSRR